MFEVIIETRVNGERRYDSIIDKRYKSRKCAVNRAEKETRKINVDGNIIERRAYVREELIVVSEDKAKEKYCHSYPVYIDGEYGKIMLTPSWHYGSHAPAEELFYRSIHKFADYDYKGNYYIEREES